jgi:HK97 family phage portal protein
VTLFRAERRDAVASGSPTYNPFENPSTPLASVGFDTVWGGDNTDAGQNVTVDTATSLPIVYRCISLISTVVAGCTVNVFKSPNQDPIRVPVLDPGNRATTYTQFELFELIVAYLAAWGDSFTFKKRDGFDSIIDLKPIYPDLVQVKPGPDGHKIFLVKRVRPDGTVSPNEKPQVFTYFEVMHIPGLGYNGLTGMSPIKLAAQAIGTGIAADKLAARFYGSGSQLGGIIKVKAPLRNQAQAEGIKNRWMSKNAGVAHAGDVAVLDAETDFQSITIPPDQLQFLESRRWQTTEIARMFGIPPHLVGDVEKSTSWGTGIEQQNIGFVAYTISSYTKRIEQRITREIVGTRGQYAEFDLTDLMRGSTSERYTAYVSSAGGPWMTRNEVRARENMQPLPDPEYDELLPPPGIAPTGEGEPEDDSQPDDSQPDNAPQPDDKPRGAK